MSLEVNKQLESQMKLIPFLPKKATDAALHSLQDEQSVPMLVTHTALTGLTGVNKKACSRKQPYLYTHECVHTHAGSLLQIWLQSAGFKKETHTHYCKSCNNIRPAGANEL